MNVFSFFLCALAAALAFYFSRKYSDNPPGQDRPDHQYGTGIHDYHSGHSGEGYSGQTDFSTGHSHHHGHDTGGHHHSSHDTGSWNSADSTDFSAADGFDFSGGDSGGDFSGGDSGSSGSDY